MMTSFLAMAKLKMETLDLPTRHSRCLQPQQEKITNPGVGQDRKRRDEFQNTKESQFAPLAQIRGIPLFLSQLRCTETEGESRKFLRSSYVVNTQNVKVNGRRARSLSPQILRTSALAPLTSPKLVRSSSFPRKSVGRSFIPVRPTRASLLRQKSFSERPTSVSLSPHVTIMERKQIRRVSTESRKEASFADSTLKKPSSRSSSTEKKSPGETTNHQEKITLQHDGSSSRNFTKNEPMLGKSINETAGYSFASPMQGILSKDDELGAIIPSSGGGRKSHLRSQSQGPQLFGIAAIASEHHHRSCGPNANGHPRARRMKMDIRSPSSPPSNPRSGGARMMAKTVSVIHQPVYGHTLIHQNKTSSSDYPIYNNHYYYKPPSVSSSIYSEPVRSRSSQKQGTLPRSLFGRPPPPSVMFDDDPGIMSEAETSSTGFRRGGKARSSLPVVRTPSKTLERPLGLVFLQYRTETKRALLPNEITSLDTVKALFVRSFPRQLTMEYLDAMNVKIYIHDGAKDMFYELEDLRDVRDRSVLRLFEPNINGNGAVPAWDQDQSYFSEPEFDSEFQHQHIHKTKGNKTSPYVSYSYSQLGATNSLPRPTRPFSPAAIPIKPAGSSAPAKPLRQYSTLTKKSPIVVTADSAIYSPRTTGAFHVPPASYVVAAPDPRRNIYAATDPAYVSSPERRYVEDPYYAHFPPARSGSITPVIIDERIDHMERQLANLTGLVQKALVPPAVPSSVPPARISYSATLPRALPLGGNSYRDYIPTRDYRTTDDIDKQSSSSSASLPDDPVRPNIENHTPASNAISHAKAPKFGKEKSVSFSDDPPEHGKQHSPSQYSAEKPTKPAIKSTTLPRDRALKVAPISTVTVVPRPNPILPPQPAPVNIPMHPYDRQYYSGPRGEPGLSPEAFNQLRNLQKKTRDLKGDIRALRRSVQAQAHTVRETIKDTFLKFKVAAAAGNDQWMQGDPEKARIRREREYYKQEMMKLEKDVEGLELTVEGLRSQVITKRVKVNMSDVENMALVLSRSSKSVADLKARFPVLHGSLKNLLTNEMDQVMLEERFLKEEPERLEITLRRCKKLTGTLVTLKRLASVQEQRIPVQDGEGSPVSQAGKVNNRGASATTAYGITPGSLMGTPLNYDTGTAVGPENALDDLLNELDGTQATYKQNRLEPPKRLPSYPSTESGSPVRSPLRAHPPLPPKPTKIPPLPPPRTSSKSPIVSPSIESSGGESSESINSQDANGGSNRLSQRHQELLRKQKLLQEQYSRLQMLQQRSVSSNASNNGSDKLLELKKTGSESNLRAKLGLEFSAAPTGSLSNINKPVLYETDIL